MIVSLFTSTVSDSMTSVIPCQRVLRGYRGPYLGILPSCVKMSKFALAIILARAAFAAGNMFMGAATDVSRSSLLFAAFLLALAISDGSDPCSSGAAATISSIIPFAASSASFQYLHWAAAGKDVGHGTPREGGWRILQFSRPGMGRESASRRNSKLSCLPSEVNEIPTGSNAHVIGRIL